MAHNEKSFLVSTADFALYYDEHLVCTGTTNLNTSIEVSMQEQNVNAGKGNKLVYSYKYGRELSVTLEAADWKLEYLAANLGTKISEGIKDIYSINECVQVTNGIGVTAKMPVGEVGVELPGGMFVDVVPDGTTIDLSKYGIENNSVKATYRFNKQAKSIDIDADTAPAVYKLVLDADRHNNKLGKVGHLQVVIPSYQPSGNFTMNFAADAVSSTNIDGKALAVEGETCADGSSVYAHVQEINDEDKTIVVSEIAATPGTIQVETTGLNTAPISVIGLKGEVYSPIELNNSDCTFVADDTTIATVDENGLVTAVSAGSTFITVTYDSHIDTVDVVVDNVTTPKLMDVSVMSVFNTDETVLGKNVSDLIGDDVSVLSSGAVTGTLKYVTGFTAFNKTKVEEQSGHYFPLKLTQTGTKMTIKKNGEIRKDKANMDFDPEILLRVADNSTVFEIDVDGIKVVTLNFTKATLE